jgi:hypothetical protein
MLSAQGKFFAILSLKIQFPDASEFEPFSHMHKPSSAVNHATSLCASQQEAEPVLLKDARFESKRRKFPGKWEFFSFLFVNFVFEFF